MRTRFGWVTVAVCLASLAGCGDDSEEVDAGAMHGDGDHGDGDHGDGDHGDGDHGDGDHGDGDHTSCGLQENCSDDALELGDGIEQVASADGSYSVMIHEHDELSADDDNTWMIMLMADGMPVTGRDIKVNTYSEDCGHAGDKPVMEVTTNDMGMAMIKPSFIHGGPWSVRVDPDASSDGVAINDDDDVIIELCIPGGAHGE